MKEPYTEDPEVDGPIDLFNIGLSWGLLVGFIVGGCAGAVLGWAFS